MTENAKIVMLDVAKIIPYDNNPRKNDNSIDAVANSIREFGFKVPIVVDAKNVIVAGHTRLEACKKLGIEKVPCVIADDLSPAQIKAFRLADNKVAELSSWDVAKLEKELADIEIDMSKFAFELKDAEPMISPDTFSDTFTLPSGAKNEICTISFTLHELQLETIKNAIGKIDEVSETFGNTNANGNKLYEVVKQWEELRRLS